MTACFVFPAGDLDLVVGNYDGMLNYFANGFCTTSCGGRGVCDGSANLLPTCDCLTGFTGDQCDECQAGYFGSACELSKIDDAASNSASVSDARRDTCGESLHASRRLVEASAPRWRRRRVPRPRSQTRNFTQASSPPIFERNVIHQVVRPVWHLQLEPVQVGREDQLAPQPRIVPRFMS